MTLILEWLSDGRDGTCDEISEAIGVPVRSVKTLMTIGSKLNYVAPVGTRERKYGGSGKFPCVWRRTTTQPIEKAPMPYKDRRKYEKGNNPKKLKVIEIIEPVTNKSLVQSAINARIPLETYWMHNDEKA